MCGYVWYHFWYFGVCVVPCLVGFCWENGTKNGSFGQFSFYMFSLLGVFVGFFAIKMVPQMVVAG